MTEEQIIALERDDAAMLRRLSAIAGELQASIVERLPPSTERNSAVRALDECLGWCRGAVRRIQHSRWQNRS